VARALHSLGSLSARHPIPVILLWIAVAVALTLVVRTVGAETTNDLTLPGTGSQQATDLLEARFPPQQNGSSPVVFHAAKAKVTDAENKQAIEASYKAILKQPHVYSARDPFENAQAGLISKDGHYAFIPVVLDVGSGNLDEETAQNVLDAADPGLAAGMEVAVGGSIGSELSQAETESSEIIGITAAMIILALTFGSLVAMGMPILTAIIGLSIALALIGLLGHLFNVPTVGTTLATMIGLGVGIDYALFLVTRHHDQLREGVEVKESIARAVSTAGTAIVFAGSTVVIALVSLMVAGIPLVTSLGYSSAIAVLTAVLGAISLLPALLGLVGRRIDSLRVPAFLRPKPRPPLERRWARWARLVVGHPWLTAAIALLLLAPLIVPVFSLELGQEDVGAAPKSTTQRQAYDLMAAGFGVGYNGPLLIATELDPPAKPSASYEQMYNQALSLKNQLEQGQKSLEAQQKELEQQQNALEQKQAQLQREQSSLLQQQSSLEAQAAQLQQQQASLQAQKTQLEQQEAALLAQKQQLEQEAAQLRAQAEKLARRLAAIRLAERRTEQALQRAKDPARIRRLEDRLAALQREQQQARAQIPPLRRRAEALVAQARSLQAQANSLQYQADQLQAQANSLQYQADQLQAQQASLEAQGADLQAQGNQLRAQGAALQQQGAALQQQATELQAEQKQAEQLQDQLTQELTKAGGDDRGTDPRIVKLQDALAQPADVDTVTPPQIDKSGDAMIMTVIAKSAPSAPETADLVKQLRASVIPAATTPPQTEAFVGGQTASYVDLATKIADKLPLVILVVISLSFVVLFLAFRSLLVPLQAAITNLVSVAAAFGVLTAVFQWGWGLSLVGVDTPDGTVPIASYVPLMMFAVLFGLSMDYQVFLLSQMEQHHLAGASPRDAVTMGLAASARVISAAAIIMISVFGSFILVGNPTVKQFGVGLSVAVFLAATMVLSLAPALLSLFGRATWWLPGWLDRHLPHISIEGEAAGANAPERAEDGKPVTSP
jgi:uncharacterized membrane protein YdfJ with MMPL/SSD domain